MLIGIDKNETFRYVSTQDKGENSTVFVIGVLTNRNKVALINAILNTDGTVNKAVLQDKAVEIFRMGVKRIENFYDPILKKAVSLESITDETLDALPIEIVFEVSGKVAEFNFANGQDVKK